MVKSRGARNCQKSGSWNLLDNWQRPYVSQKRQRHDQICLRSSAGWRWRCFWHHWVTGNCFCLPLQSDGFRYFQYFCYWGICSFVNTEFNSYSVKYNHRLLQDIRKYHYIYSYHYLFPVFVWLEQWGGDKGWTVNRGCRQLCHIFYWQLLGIKGHLWWTTQWGGIAVKESDITQRMQVRALVV